jgi:expansin (peptidoglycan-binding protein)
MNQFTSIVTALVALSIASERLVEMIKSLVPYLNEKQMDPMKEARRKAALQLLAAVAGVVTAFMAQPALDASIPTGWQTPLGMVVLGLFASGGSGFWNSIQNLAQGAGNLKGAQAEAQEKVMNQPTSSVLGPITR